MKTYRVATLDADEAIEREACMVTLMVNLSVIVRGWR
jgi:hypothetical protein